MTRGGFLKSLLMLAIAPKVLSEINITSTRQAVIGGSKGIYAYIEQNGSVVDYEPSSFRLEDFHKIIEIMDKNK